ncbi:MAG: hypothetical protein A2Y86_05280 [Candidatus Aminicenantes bacterium RBG_13_62_12]|nr:MAG: hypothetical protein A2Y86_05280 [Candidatus Aminicenantes bacterium RBG_13_62_12]
MSILTGEDLVLGTVVPYQWLNDIKNQWRASGAPADIVPGMLFSDADDDKLYHCVAGSGGVMEEILQETKSADKSPMFNGVVLDVKSADVSDPPTSAELFGAFGSDIADGFTGLVQDASSLGSLWLASYSDGWWVVELTPAA